MKIADILQRKSRHSGSDVVTATPTGTVRELLSLLARENVGAVVVRAGDPDGDTDGDTASSTASSAVAGIVSERDIVRRLHERGAAVLDAPVAEIMTTVVVSCAPDDDLDDVAGVMTDRRIRHMPVLDGETLVGLVSIGDVVFSRIHQLEVDRGQLEQYITG